MVLLDPCSLYFQLFSFFFFCSACFEKDVLLIRICLVLAYVFIIANSATGFPSWPDLYSSPARYSADALAWGILCFIIHVRGLYYLLCDQKPVSFKSEDEKSLARFLYRRAGMREWEAEEAMKKGSFVHVKAGDVILTDRASLYLLIEGKATFRTCVHGVEDEERTARSGDLLDLAVLNAIGIRVGFMEVEFNARADTDCLLYRWPLSSLLDMTDGSWPALLSGWQNLALYSISAVFNQLSHRGMQDVTPLDSQGEPESEKWLEGGRSRDFGEWALGEGPGMRPNPSLVVRVCLAVRDYGFWIVNSFSCTPIKGLRHLGPVTSGLSAQEQLRAVAEQAAKTNGSKKTMVVEGWYKNSKMNMSSPFMMSTMKMGSTMSSTSLQKQKTPV